MPSRADDGCCPPGGLPMFCRPDPTHAENLRRWKESGAARAWVEAHRGEWDHDDWLGLLDELKERGCGSPDPDAVGQVLEGARERWLALQRWRESEHPRRWVEAHEGAWDHDDW